MLKIRKEQMAVFQQQAERNFISSVVKYLHTNYAEALKNVSEEKLYKRVEYGVKRARGYGLTWKNNLSTFVTLMFVIAPDFDRSPLFQKFLADESIPPNERMDVLLRETTEVGWRNARQDIALIKWPEEML